MINFIPKLSYIKFRIDSFFDLTSKGNYQSERASEAIMNGGFFGKGIGEGTLNVRVPEAHTDYVIAVIAEEFGIISIIGIILIFLCLIFRVFKKVSTIEDECFKLILVGSVMLILFQVLVHIGVNIRFLPTTGMTLPFLSYGGSSIIGSSILIGVIFHFLSDITKTLGQSGSLNIFLSVWSTPIIFNLLLISALIHLEDG